MIVLKENEVNPFFILGWDQNEDNEEEESIDVRIDPNDQLLSLCNTADFTRIAMISLENIKCLDSENKQLESNRGCVTFIILAPPRTIFDLCYLKGNLLRMKLSSHFSDTPYAIQDYQIGSYDLPVFPLRGDQFLCTQSSMGEFTHFQHNSTANAVDFRCDIGTQCISLCNGIVLNAGGFNNSEQIRNPVVEGGISVSNLFSWNGVVIKSDEGIIFEYIHVHHEGIRVKKGDCVRTGDVICLSGSSGFCPEPHLHIEAHLENQENNSSLNLLWKGKEFVAGLFYGQNI